MRRAKGASFCSSQGASAQNLEAGEGRIVNRLAITDKQAIGRACGTTTKPSWD